ncbi:Hypothetical predicted protein, partial [Pelobates cultripes]
MTAGTDRVRVTEEDLSTVIQCQTDASTQVQKLQASHKTLQDRLDMLDDARLRNNIKIRGIAKSIDDRAPPLPPKATLGKLASQ